MPFPHALDKDKDGILYIQSDLSGQNNYMDGRDYQQTLSTLLQGSAEIQMIWSPMA